MLCTLHPGETSFLQDVIISPLTPDLYKSGPCSPWRDTADAVLAARPCALQTRCIARVARPLTVLELSWQTHSKRTLTQHWISYLRHWSGLHVRCQRTEAAFTAHGSMLIVYENKRRWLMVESHYVSHHKHIHIYIYRYEMSIIEKSLYLGRWHEFNKWKKLCFTDREVGEVRTTYVRVALYLSEGMMMMVDWPSVHTVSTTHTPSCSLWPLEQPLQFPRLGPSQMRQLASHLRSGAQRLSTQTHKVTTKKYTHSDALQQRQGWKQAHTHTQKPTSRIRPAISR